jgi:N-acetylmuramoyl-L-alanine amidase
LTGRARALIAQATATVAVSALLCVTAAHLAGQNLSTPLVLVSKDLRRSIPTFLVGTQDFVGLDDLATAFQLTVREESGAITVSYRARTIVLTTDQALASVAGRLISLPAPPSRAGARWLVPVEFINRALALIYDQKLELRRPSRLVIIGDLRVPRVTVRYEPLANAARLTIDATPKASSALTQDGARLLIKFDADSIDAALPTLQPQGLVSGVRQADGVTLGVDLGPRFAAFRASTEAIEDTTRLVVDLVGADANTAAAPGRGGTIAPAAPVAPAPPPDVPALVAPAASIRTIAVDAGHGGDDYGVKGPGGALEKDVTLAVARRLKATIEARLGVRVLLTRDEDRNIPLDDRVAIANNSKADLLISLHANGSLRGAPSGASIYVASFGDASTGSRLIPERVPTITGGSRDIELVEWDLAQLRYLDSSNRIAGIMREQFNGRVPLDEHQVFRSGPFPVLESANMPAVLIEMGYLSTADQEHKLAGTEFQTTFVQAVMDSIVKFRDALDESAGVVR